WDPATQSATFSDGTTEVIFNHNSSTAIVNGVPTEIRASGLRADARIINDRFFVPIAFFRYIFNADVSWNAHNRTVSVAVR
ncbi:MAG: copper amine oxidase N-terminal domain-containing protein, partial [Defluviitaleaceae bacterium]|nr:copper amine oxidase N-terminal domain-containing protein [Defluviitaleaceae bacterium]